MKLGHWSLLQLAQMRDCWKTRSGAPGLAPRCARGVVCGNPHQEALTVGEPGESDGQFGERGSAAHVWCHTLACRAALSQTGKRRVTQVPRSRVTRIPWTCSVSARIKWNLNKSPWSPSRSADTPMLVSRMVRVT